MVLLAKPIIKNSLILYSREKCNYCVKSKQLLSNNKIPFTEIKLDPAHNNYEDEKNNLKLKTKGHSTFPFIFVGPSFLGGFSELNHSLNTNLSEKLKKIGITFEPDLDF